MAGLKHIAIIMDGNGRWARKRGLPRIVGHKEGVESVRSSVKSAIDLGIKYLTLYTFSTENWHRPEKEVNFLMKMLKDLIVRETPDLKKEGVRVNCIGRLNEIQPAAQAALQKAMAATSQNDKMVLTLCLSYGGRGEIIDAVRRILTDDRKTNLDLKAVDEDFFSRYLYDPGLPEPDLMIRTGARSRERISNFLLWQIAYTELYFTETLWPDFREKEFEKAISDFGKRERLYGRIN